MPFIPDTSVYCPRQRLPLPPTPTKFTPSEFRESDYDSEIDSVRIRPVWSPNPNTNEPQYRRVIPPTPTRSVSLPRNYERILTPMEFDRVPPEMPSKIRISPPPSPHYFTDSHRTQTLDRFLSKKKSKSHVTTRDDIGISLAPQSKIWLFSRT